MNVEVKNAAIKSSLFLSYGYTQTESDIKNVIKTSSDAPIHEDLRNAFKSLIPHFAHICEEVMDVDLVKRAIANPGDYIGEKETVQSEEFLKFMVSGFVLSNDGEGVVILGNKRLLNYDEIALKTPLVKFDGDYAFSNDLQINIELLKSEVLAYMEGKQAPKAQIELFADEEEDDSGI